jgi:Inositol hexakisphosphate
VYENLKSLGYRVDYHRLPLTDGKAPQPSAFDAIYNGVSMAKQQDPVIINCQMGGGRTTTAMVVACLVRHLAFGAIQFPHYCFSWWEVEHYRNPEVHSKYLVDGSILVVLSDSSLKSTTDVCLKSVSQ